MATDTKIVIKASVLLENLKLNVDLYYSLSLNQWMTSIEDAYDFRDFKAAETMIEILKKHLPVNELETVREMKVIQHENKNYRDSSETLFNKPGYC